MAKQEWRINKDGSLETLGQRQDRLQRVFNAKVWGTAALAVGGVVALFNAAVDVPVLQETVSNVISNPIVAETTVRLASGLSGFVSLIGTAWLGLSAAKQGEICRNTQPYVDIHGRDYRPGDNARRDKELLAGKNKDEATFVSQIPAFPEARGWSRTRD